MARDLATIVATLLEREQAAFRAELEAAGFTPEFVAHPGNRLRGDRTATFGHALLAGALEGA